MTRSAGRLRASATTSTNASFSSVTSTGSRSCGRRVKVWMPSTMFGKTVTQSRSAKVKTVSRCIAARSFGIPATITRSAAPFAKSEAASCVIACREERSLMPTSTTPLPAGITSPPSSVARPQSCSGSPHQTSAPTKSGWNV
jgi:hypothetical protein